MHFKYEYLLRKIYWYSKYLTNASIYIKSRNYWINNEDIYKNRRGFVIGNGPSLKFEDLEKLINEVTIASNKIYLAFDHTQWRPLYYTCADRILWRKIKKETGIYFNEIIIPCSFNEIPYPEKIVFFPNIGHFESKKDGGFSSNVIKGIYGAGTITYINIQIAVHLGLNPIYLIGCDHSYQNEKKVNKRKELIRHLGPSNHFIDNYRSEGEIVSYAPIDLMTKGYDKAKTFCEKNGIKIFNATRGGCLEVFDRVDFDALF